MKDPLWITFLLLGIQMLQRESCRRIYVNHQRESRIALDLSSSCMERSLCTEYFKPHYHHYHLQLLHHHPRVMENVLLTPKALCAHFRTSFALNAFLNDGSKLWWGAGVLEVKKPVSRCSLFFRWRQPCPSHNRHQYTELRLPRLHLLKPNEISISFLR